MYRLIIIFLSVIIAGLLLCACQNCSHQYHSDDNNFSFTIIAGKDSSLLIFQNQDTVIYDGNFKHSYSEIQFVVPDSIKTIYLLDSSNRIKRVISYSYKIVVVKGFTLKTIENALSSAKLTNDSCATQCNPTINKNGPMVACLIYPRANVNPKEKKIVCFTYPSCNVNPEEGKLVSTSGCRSYYGNLYEHGEGLLFTYCRNGKFRSFLKPQNIPLDRE